MQKNDHKLRKFTQEYRGDHKFTIETNRAVTELEG